MYGGSTRWKTSGGVPSLPILQLAVPASAATATAPSSGPRRSHRDRNRNPDRRALPTIQKLPEPGAAGYLYLERMIPSAASYREGVALLLAMLAALGLGGYWLRHWLVPAYGGALARLGELVLALALLIVTLEAIGSFGLLSEGPMVAAAVAAGLLAAALGWWRAPRPAAMPKRPPPVPAWAIAIAVTVAAVAIVEWSLPSQRSLLHGIFSGDSTWYHLPFATRFAQSHSTWALLYTDPLALTAWFYPASSELLGAVGILLFHSDWLAPLVNLSWLALGLLAAYCVGRPFGVGPATLVAGGIGLDSGVLVLTQAGEARNDAMAIALLLAFAALLINGWREDGWGPLALAGLAGGLAVSVKLTMLAPVGCATLVAVAALALRRGGARRLAAAAALLGAELLSGGYWYLRNLAHSGNPVPELHGIGPIALPHPNQMNLYPRPPRSVADYLFDAHVVRDWFLPGLHEALGPLFPLLLLLGLAAAVWAIAARREAAPAALGLAALLTAAVYVFTPLTAAGPPGQPHGFLTNTRYLLPALTLALALLPLAGPLRRRGSLRVATLCLLAALFAIGAAANGEWYSRFLAGGVLAAAALVVLPAAAGWLRAARGLARPLALALAIAMLVPAIVLGHGAEAGYARHHYTLPTQRAGEPGGPAGIFAWARGLHGRRIALAGSGRLFFDQALFAGDDSSNWVQYLGETGPQGAFREAPGCAAFRRLLDRGRYEFLVLTQNAAAPPARSRLPIGEWVRGTAALRPLRSEGVVSAYRIRGPLSSRGCPRRPGT